MSFVSGFAWSAGTYPMPIPMSSIGEWEPDVTSPPPSIGMPWRGIAVSSITNATSLRSGPSAFTRRSVSTPVNSLSSAQTQPSPAEIASVSGPMSLPCSG